MKTLNNGKYRFKLGTIQGLDEFDLSKKVQSLVYISNFKPVGKNDISGMISNLVGVSFLIRSAYPMLIKRFWKKRMKNSSQSSRTILFPSPVTSQIRSSLQVGFIPRFIYNLFPSPSIARTSTYHQAIFVYIILSCKIADSDWLRDI